MTDRALERIRKVTKADLTFQWMRAEFKNDHGVKASLNFGHAVLDTDKQLDEYLYTYGPMIESQWRSVAPHLSGIAQPALVIDYGCGQGLAGLLVNDLTGGKLFAAVRDVILIEPSAVAIARAVAVYERLAPEAEVTAICKLFDDLAKSDMPAPHSGATLHLFSNSLDVTGFDPLRLLSDAVQPGRHTLISVSHDRNFNGGTPRIESVKAAFEQPAMASELTIQRSTLDHFTCDNPSRSGGVVWICEFEVKDG